MSSLTEQERIGLEEVFLSISSSRNLFHKWNSWRQRFSTLVSSSKGYSPLTTHTNTDRWIKNSLKTHKITKLLLKIHKRRKI